VTPKWNGDNVLKSVGVHEFSVFSVANFLGYVHNHSVKSECTYMQHKTLQGLVVLLYSDALYMLVSGSDTESTFTVLYPLETNFQDVW